MYSNAVSSWNRAAASRVFGGKKLWYDLRQYSGICPEGLSKSTHNVCLAGGCLDWHLNLKPPESEAGMLPTA